MDFQDKSGETLQCKMSCIPVRLCELLLVMSLQFIRNRNLFTTLAAGYIGLLSSIHVGIIIFLMELKEDSRRIYEVPPFIFYALGYAIERVLSMSRKGVNGFLITTA